MQYIQQCLNCGARGTVKVLTDFCKQCEHSIALARQKPWASYPKLARYTIKEVS